MLTGRVRKHRKFYSLFIFAESGARAARKQIAVQQHHEVLGVGIYYFTYSTWEGPVLYVEDLFVIPAARGKLISASLRMGCAQGRFNNRKEQIFSTRHLTDNVKNSKRLLINQVGAYPQIPSPWQNTAADFICKCLFIYTQVNEAL